MTTRALSDEEWSEQVTGFGRHDGDLPSDDAEGADVDGTSPVFDDAGTEPVDLDAEGESAPRRFDHGVAWGFAGVVAAALTVVLVAAAALHSRDAAPAQSGGGIDEPRAVQAAAPAPAPSPVPPAPGVDRPLPYTADARGSCAPGSTPAQTMSGEDPRNAFVCVRGGADGQTITLDLGRTHVITAIALTPGWVGLDASGVSQWSQHRVVTLVQYVFDDPDRTLITQDTRNVHGEAVQPVRRVLASRVQLLIRQTSRPPVEPRHPAAPPESGGLLPGVFGDEAPVPSTRFPDDAFGRATDDPNGDPVDATFAIGALKIIGHEAI